MMDFISQYGSPMDALFALLALFYLILICVNFDSRKRGIFIQTVITGLNVALVFASFLTHSMFLLVLWCICLIINGTILKGIWADRALKKLLDDKD